MSDAYIGEIRLVSYPAGKVPRGWLPCDGRPLSIQQYTPLFALLSTTYGGDGKVSFNIPDLRGRVPVAAGNAAARGSHGGQETVTLTADTMPAHTHMVYVNAAAGTQTKTNDGIYAASPATTPIYGHPTNLVPLGQTAPQLKATGGDSSHENRQPYIALSYIICVNGLFPPRP